MLLDQVVSILLEKKLFRAQFSCKLFFSALQSSMYIMCASSVSATRSAVRRFNDIA